MNELALAFFYIILLCIITLSLIMDEQFDRDENKNYIRRRNVNINTSYAAIIEKEIIRLNIR